MKININKSYMRSLFIDLEKTNTTRFYISIIFIYLIFAVLIITMHYIYNGIFSKILYPFLFFTIGLIQYILAQALHEAWHYYFHGLSGGLSRVFISYPLGMPISARAIHLMHHAKFGDPIHDPDYKSYMNKPVGKQTWFLFFVVSLSGISAIKRLMEIIGNKPTRSHEIKGNNISEFTQILIIQIIIFCIFSISTNYYFYFIFWCAPILIIVKTLTNIRLMLEHGNFAGAPPVLRSFLKSNLASKLIGAYGFEYHAEHHIAPNVECNKLHLVRRGVMGAPSSINADLTGIEYVDESYTTFFIKKML